MPTDKNIYLKDIVEDGYVDRSNSKGKRLIILHAITREGPLGERARLGVPLAQQPNHRGVPRPRREVT